MKWIALPQAACNDDRIQLINTTFNNMKRACTLYIQENEHASSI